MAALAAGEAIPGEHDLLRYASPRFVDKDSVSGAAFVARVGDHGQLSCNSIGFEAGDHASAVNQVRQVSRMTLRKNGRFAQLNCDRVKSCCEGVNGLAALAVIADPLPSTEEHKADPSHVLVGTLPEPESELAALAGDLIAQHIIKVHPAIAP